MEREATDDVVMIELARLEPDPHLPAVPGTERELPETLLPAPLVVRPAQGEGAEGRYWVVLGGDRLRAAQREGWTALPCRVRRLSDRHAALVGVIDMIAAGDLPAIARSDALEVFLGLALPGWGEATPTAGVPAPSREWLTAAAFVMGEMAALSPLLSLPPGVKELAREGRLSEGVLRLLAALPEPLQEELAGRAARDGLTTVAAAAEIRRLRRHAPERFDRPLETQLDDVFREIAALRREMVRLWGKLEAVPWSAGLLQPARRERVEELYTTVCGLQLALIWARVHLDDQPKEGDGLPF
jgi:ParB-like chromosome segregation protein Spo0J